MASCSILIWAASRSGVFLALETGKRNTKREKWRGKKHRGREKSSYRWRTNERRRRQDEMVSKLYTRVGTKVYDHAPDRSEPVPDTILHLWLQPSVVTLEHPCSFDNTQNQSIAKITSAFFNFRDRDLNSSCISLISERLNPPSGLSAILARIDGNFVL